MNNAWIYPMILTVAWCVFWGLCLTTSHGGGIGNAIARAMSWGMIFIGTSAIWVLYGVTMLIMSVVL